MFSVHACASAALDTQYTALWQHNKSTLCNRPNVPLRLSAGAIHSSNIAGVRPPRPAVPRHDDRSRGSDGSGVRLVPLLSGFPERTWGAHCGTPWLNSHCVFPTGLRFQTSPPISQEQDATQPQCTARHGIGTLSEEGGAWSCLLQSGLQARQGRSPPPGRLTRRKVYLQHVRGWGETYVNRGPQ